MGKKEPSLKAQQAFKKAEPYINISYTLIGAMGLFGYLGHWLDEKLQVHPYLLLLGIFVGLFLGYYNMVKVIKGLDKR